MRRNWKSKEPFDCAQDKRAQGERKKSRLGRKESKGGDQPRPYIGAIRRRGAAACGDQPESSFGEEIRVRQAEGHFLSHRMVMRCSTVRNSGSLVSTVPLTRWAVAMQNASA